MSAAFYTTLLDTTAMVSGDHLVALDAGEGTVLLLFQRGLTTAPVQTSGGLVPPHDAGGPGHLAFAIHSDEVQVWEERLARLGIPGESPRRRGRGGFRLYLPDPGKRLFELAPPRIWAAF